ncbi:DUF4097 family beta strand repeat-containing protein [Lentibacillus amyloliquefaciens]|uniref:DUF4097 domain-containing protein n=1 Tax=Lentibacillus amyloliquefaciens TaxID=1472767 RepID=A0A0U4FD67_9BACI|nr:DUF4097 family beta strand repeat-containing protein [Lentibacillus amyloliquefaciens]ALX48413.1 hypothetical protein AOX59_07185 [Lentibacillus amyloliquefaciens]
MINAKRISIIALVLLVVGALGSLLTFQSLNDSTSVSEEETFSDNNITDIEISANNEEVEVMSTEDRATKVELTGTSSEEIENYLSADVEDETLSIELKDKRLFDFFNFIGTNLTLKVYLPEKTYNSLQADIDNGSFQVEQLSINNVEGEVDNGHFDMKDIAAAMVNVEADNGAISLENIEGKINGDVNNGEIYLKTNNLDHPLTLESNNGDIEVETDQEPTNAVFDIKTNNGEATVFGSSNWNTVIGNGDNQIKLTTNNGNINVVK